MRPVLSGSSRLHRLPFIRTTCDVLKAQDFLVSLILAFALRKQHASKRCLLIKKAKTLGKSDLTGQWRRREKSL